MATLVDVRVAVYHNLPAGGARRQMIETVARAGDGSWTVFEPQDSVTFESPYASAVSDSLVHDRARRVQLPPGAPRTHGPLKPLENLVRIARVEAQVLERITPDLFDVALIYPCRFTQAPALLGRISVPALYYAPEPRRRSFERDYHTALPRSRSAAALRSFAGAFLVERWLRRRDRHAFLSATDVACNSRHTAARLLECYGREATVCYPGVDAEVFTPRPETGTHPRSVVSVGALDPSKGHDLVIDALATLDADVRPRLIIVHERSAQGYDATLIRRAAALDVELELRCGISDAALADTYSSATATLAAARREPFGLTPLESLACGTPVIAIREGGFCETIEEGVNGHLTDPTSEALAAALLDVIHGGLAARPPRAIRDTVVPRWTWDASARCVNAMLVRLAGSGFTA